MRVTVFQHVAFEGLGTIGQWLTGRGAHVHWTRFHLGDRPARAADCDLLIVMGGPMGAYEEVRYPWLRDEKRAIREAIDGGLRVLGICLGAQLVAAALGARVGPGLEKEIGWHPVVHARGAKGSAFTRSIPDGSLVFHWHGDTFDLPPGAVSLLSSEGCANQAFQIGQAVLGIQFHLETTVELARGLVENCRADLAPGRFVQDETEIIGHPRRFAELKILMRGVMDCLAGEEKPADSGRLPG